MTRLPPFGRVQAGAQFALGLGLVAAPWAYEALGLAGGGWAVMLAGAMVALAAAARLSGYDRPGAGASLPAALAAFATLLLPDVAAVDGLAWNIGVTGAVALLALVTPVRSPRLAPAG